MEKQLKTVYTIIEKDKAKGQKPYFLKIGIGSVNSDGSLNLKLDALPSNMTLHVRDFESTEDRDARLSRRHADETAAYPGLA